MNTVLHSCSITIFILEKIVHVCISSNTHLKYNLSYICWRPSYDASITLEFSSVSRMFWPNGKRFTRVIVFLRLKACRGTGPKKSPPQRHNPEKRSYCNRCRLSTRRSLYLTKVSVTDCELQRGLNATTNLGDFVIAVMR